MNINNPCRIVALTLSVLPFTAFAQFEPTTREALHGCAVLDTVPRRLECIDAVLARAQAEATPASAEPAQRTEASARADAATPQSRVQHTEAQARTDTAAPQSRAQRTEAPARTDTAAPRSDAPASAGESAAPANVAAGNREAPSPNNEAARIGTGERMIVVVDVTTRIPGRAVFTTEDGRRFVQTSGGSRLFLPDVPFEAELRDGAIGGLFLSPVEQGRTVRVTLSD